MYYIISYLHEVSRVLASASELCCLASIHLQYLYLYFDLSDGPVMYAFV